MASWSQNASPRPTNGGRTPAYKAAPAVPGKVFKGCSKIADYDVLRKLGEGTFGEVHQAKSRKTGAVVALKKILMHNEKDGFPITALREIKLLKLLDHINILRLEEMAVEHVQKPNDKRKRSIMYMVTPYMDHDLSGLLENPSVHFTVPQIKCYMIQLLRGTAYLHEQHILHRDMKAANLLINNKGILQIADFGLARHYEGEVPHAGGFTGEAVREYTTLVVTRWYRPPELLLQLRKYTPAIDLWGVGCVFGEMLVGRPILAGESDTRQLEIIFDLVGSPSPENMPGWNQLPGGIDLKPPFRSPTIARRFANDGPGAISLLTELLKLDWRKRLNAVDALQHRYFTDDPPAARPEDIPHFEESHELDRRGGKGHKGQGLPPAPRGYAVGGEPGNNAGARPYANGDSYGNHSRGHENGGYRGRGGYQNTWRAGEAGRLPHHDRPPHRGRGDYGANVWGGGDGSRSDRPHREHHERRDSRDRDHRPVRSPRRGGGDVYVPSYSSGRRDDRIRDDRRSGWEDRDDRGHHSRPHRERLDYDDRGRGGHTRSTRSRSRSPFPPRERVRDRESLERDVYRR